MNGERLMTEIIKTLTSGVPRISQPNAEALAGIITRKVIFLASEDVHRVVAEGDGFWSSCSGCLEMEDGYSPVPVDPVFKCQLGNGCGECGGIGAVWDTTDYAAWNAMAEELKDE